MAIEFTVDHDHTYASEVGFEQLIGWITFSVGTAPGDFRYRDPSAGIAQSIKLPPRRGWLAADGHLYRDQTLADPCRLVANDPLFNLRHLTYRADFALTTLAGDPVPVPPTWFAAPGSDTLLQLTKVMTDPYQPVMEVRAKVYTEDILDAGEFGTEVLFAGTTEDFWEAAGTVPSANLPSYVDDVMEYNNLAAFPATGETGKIYVAKDTGDSYRWSGTQYTRVSERVNAAGITDSTTVGRAVITAADAQAARTAIGAAASADVVARRFEQSVVTFGDSIVEVSRPDRLSASSPAYSQRGFEVYANAFLGWRFDIIKNSGISGNTLADMYARINADVLAYSPAWVWMDGGVNDILIEGASYATIIGRFQQIFDTLKANNIRVMCVTVTPVSSFNSTKNLVRAQVNQWLRAYGAANPNVVVVDTAPYLQDPTSDGPASGYTHDGLHPSARGAMAMGWAIAQALKDITVPRSILTAGTDPTNILAAGGMFNGDTSGLATLWRKSESGSASTYSKVARTDAVLGEWQRVVTPAGANSSAIFLTDDVTTGFSVGDTIYGAVELAMSNPDLAATESQLRTYIQLSCRDSTGNVSLASAISSDNNGAAESHIFPLNYSATLRTPNIVVPASTEKLRLILWGYGGATRDWARAVIRKVS